MARSTHWQYMHLLLTWLVIAHATVLVSPLLVDLWLSLTSGRVEFSVFLLLVDKAASILFLECLGRVLSQAASRSHFHQKARSCSRRHSCSRDRDVWEEPDVYVHDANEYFGKFNRRYLHESNGFRPNPLLALAGGGNMITSPRRVRDHSRRLASKHLG